MNDIYSQLFDFFGSAEDVSSLPSLFDIEQKLHNNTKLVERKLKELKQQQEYLTSRLNEDTQNLSEVKTRIGELLADYTKLAQ